MDKGALPLDDILQAADRIKDHAVKTPVLTSALLSEVAGGPVFVKPENFQYSGSFKFRGAFNRLVQLTEDERQKGVVAWSSGNHAQGVAAAAKLLSMPATIVMPKDAPKVKVARTEAYGAKVVPYDRYTESREDIARGLSQQHQMTLVPSYDDPHIMRGQGTAGLELFGQVEERGAALDLVLCCCGGGGLIAGISSVFNALSPKTEIYSVEPSEFNDHERSLVSGQRETVDPNARSICDALLAPTPGEMTFAVNQHTLSGGLSVTDDEVRDAMRFAYRELKLVIEPGGAVALAALLAKKIETKGKSVGIIISGGNVDAEMFAEIITAS
ncbi:MAG: threonine/serine dehydratase [Pseudomonadota bacterium]